MMAPTLALLVTKKFVVVGPGPTVAEQEVARVVAAVDVVVAEEEFVFGNECLV